MSRNPFLAPMPWQCNCRRLKVDRHDPGHVKTNPGSLDRCPDCGTARPLAARSGAA